MPPIFSRPIAIDQEWAVLLIGICINIPDSWWAGNTCLLLNGGAISHLDFHQQNELYFQPELDDDKGIYHAMRYNVVLLYVDKSMHYYLPYAAIANPTNDHMEIT
jgi:hypothetical protein